MMYRYCFALFLRTHGTNSQAVVQVLAQAFNDDTFYLQYQKLLFLLKEFHSNKKEHVGVSRHWHRLLSEYYLAEQYYFTKEKNDT